MTVVDTQAGADLIARTHALIPALSSRAEQTAAARRVPIENIRLLQEAGSLKTIQSRRNGGYGLGMRAHLDTISALAEGCGSTAWVAGVVHAHSWLLSHFPAEAQDDIYGGNPNAVVAAVIGPRGKATRARRRQLHALRLLALRIWQRGRRLAPARRSGARRERRCRRRRRLRGARLHRRAQGRLVRQRPDGNGLVLGDRRNPRDPRASFPLAPRVDHGLEPGHGPARRMDAQMRAGAGARARAHRWRCGHRAAGASRLSGAGEGEDHRLHRG